MLGACAEVGIVRREDGLADLGSQEVGERFVGPAEVGREADQSVARPDCAGHRDADSGDPAAELERRELVTHLDDRPRHELTVVLAALVVPRTTVEHHAAEADDRHRDPVDVERDRQHCHVLARGDHE